MEVSDLEYLEYLPTKTALPALLSDLPDGVLNVQIGHVLAHGRGSIHGIDSSPAMIAAAEAAVRTAGLSSCTFEGG